MVGEAVEAAAVNFKDMDYKPKRKQVNVLVVFLYSFAFKLVLALAAITCLVLYPVQIGSVLGDWISDFFGTVIDHAKQKR